MDHFNLLDLDNDVLNIIGDYVKADNNIREFNELIKKEIFDYIDIKMYAFNSVCYSLVGGLPVHHSIRAQ